MSATKAVRRLMSRKSVWGSVEEIGQYVPMVAFMDMVTFLIDTKDLLRHCPGT
jgi:hypothetical protein